LSLCVLYGSMYNQLLLPYKTLRDWFLLPKWSVFTARYALSSYIKQTRFVFKGLMFYKAKVAVCSEIRTKHINAMWAPRRIFKF
jgi:hypothetical protein